MVLDASAAVDFLLGTQRGKSIAARIGSRHVELHAPHLLDVEVMHALRRYVLRGQLSAERGRRAISDLSDIDIHRHPHDLFLPRMWALRDNVSPYDAAYVVLASALDAPLLTCDRRLTNASGIGAVIHLIEH